MQYLQNKMHNMQKNEKYVSAKYGNRNTICKICTLRVHFADAIP